MKQFNSAISVLVVSTILVVTMLSCNTDQTEEQTTTFEQYYTFDPASLITSLRNGNMSALVPVKEGPTLVPKEQQLAVGWYQADYFYIANTLYEAVLGDTLQGWQLNSMDFQLDCSKIDRGFQNGRFYFFKVVEEKENESRLLRFLDIDPRGNFVHVKEWEFYPRLVDLEVIDLASQNISADLALQIAESNGGAQKRQSVENACEIALVLSPSAGINRGWVVLYSRSDDHTSLFEIEINPATGEFFGP